jgi:protein-S-isoprenylcysteine O-methyltransferase Ste14
MKPVISIILDVLRWTGLAAGIIIQLAPLVNFIANYKHPIGKSTGSGTGSRRGAGVFGIAVGFFTLECLLWNPLPFSIPPTIDLVLAVLGFILLLPAAGSYLWGLFTLGKYYGFSSTLGADLYQDHRLIQHGPFRFIRHPMYLAFITAVIGGNLLFHNWTTLALLPFPLVLIRRASHEERLLESEFGDEWRGYASRVPKWFPCG